MHKTQNTLPDNTRKTSIALLQDCLHAALDLASQARQAHWNVKGPSFVPLHDLFEQVYLETSDHSDRIAERLTALGGQAHGTARATAKHSTLNAYPLGASRQSEHIEAMSSALAAFGGKVRAASSQAAEAGDPGTEDLLIEVFSAADKSLWMVESHLVS